MKGFFSIFPDSARELKHVRTITISAMFMALSVVLRTVSIPIGQDIRITFAFLGIMVIAMLYGPVVAMIANLGTDIIGYLLDGSKMREYNLALALVVIIDGLIYGLMLYQRYTTKRFQLWASLSRLGVVLIGNLILNSCILYVCYVNPAFPVMTSAEWAGFWTWMAPRLIKNLGEYPIDVILICILMPIIKTAYQRVFHQKAIAPIPDVSQNDAAESIEVSRAEEEL